MNHKTRLFWRRSTHCNRLRRVNLLCQRNRKGRLVSNHRIDNRAERLIDFMCRSLHYRFHDIINIICGFLSEGNGPQEVNILDSSAASPPDIRLKPLVMVNQRSLRPVPYGPRKRQDKIENLASVNP